MNARPNMAAIYRRFKAVGSALMRINANNTHSGNMSLRDPFDPNLFYIPAPNAGRWRRKTLCRFASPT
jgi:hypothetical protein